MGRIPLKDQENLSNEPRPPLMIVRAVLAYHKNQGVKGEMSEELLEEISDASQILAFSALSEKEYLTQVGKNIYVNSSYFRTIFQRFEEPCQYILYPAKHIDGTIINAQEIKRLKISKPLQCMHKLSDVDRFRFNKELMKALYTAKSGNDRCKRLKGAIRQYLSATRCEEWVAHEQEYIDLIISHENLFQRVGSARDIAVKISEILSPYGIIKVRESKRISGRDIPENYQQKFLHYEFMRESYLIRDRYAHGKSIGNMPLGWSEREHHIFACWMFPLVVKKILQDEGYYDLTEYDEIRLHSIDKLLNCEDWGETNTRKGKRTNITNWQHILQETRSHLATKRAIEAYRNPD